MITRQMDKIRWRLNSLLCGLRNMEILAKLELLEIDDSEWRVKYSSGMRSNINYGDDNYSCIVDFKREGEVKQGETVECEICFLTHEPHIGKLAEGMKFKLFAGNVTFASGVIQYVSE